MKQFIYLDTDIINSIIAQNQKGIVIQQSTSEENTDLQSEDRKTDLSGDIKIGGSFWKILESTAGLGFNKENSNSTTNTFASKTVIEKVLHDAAFDIANEYINPINVKIGDQFADEEGRYILIKRVFDFVDLDYLESLFSDGGLIDYIKQAEESQIREAIKDVNDGNREQRRSNNNAEIKKEIKNLIEQNNKKYDDISKVISAIRSFIPYNRMLISSDGYLIPLDEQYFRIDPKNLGFKYGGEIVCVGMITNIFGEDTNPNDDTNIFATIQYTASEALRMLLPTKENNICVMHPIAVYYES